MAQTQVHPCKCKNDYQDSVYGSGMRLWNYGEKIGGNGGWRCTVCMATRNAPSKVVEVKKEAKK